MTLEQLTQVERLTIKSDEVLLVRLPSGFRGGPDEALRIKSIIESKFGFDVRVLVIPAGVELTVITDAKADEIEQQLKPKAKA